MKVVGYSSRLSARPGEKIAFKVSCGLSSYAVQMVRLIDGDSRLETPGFEEELVESQANGEYPGKEQTLSIGSYVVVPDHPRLREMTSFTIQAWIYVTLFRRRVTGIVTKLPEGDSGGYGLFIDQKGELLLRVMGDDRVVADLTSGCQLRRSMWYFVAASFDAALRELRVLQQPVGWWSPGELASRTKTVSQLDLGTNHGPLLIGAYQKGHSNQLIEVAGLFNGKIDSPKLFSRALKETDIERLRSNPHLGRLRKWLIASWDFSRAISTKKVVDLSESRLHGKTVNGPKRAVTGHNWDGEEANFRRARQQYGAIHLHEDDLDDAAWSTDFNFEIPAHLRSGVYAARLRAGSYEDYVPFFILPERGRSSNIAFLAPTFTYLAYANEHTLLDARLRGNLELRSLRYPVQPQDRYIVENVINSLYDHHTDGSGVCYASTRRPLVTMRPKYLMPGLANGSGSPHGLTADLYILHWMEKKGFEYDVITDEDLHREGQKLLSPYKVIMTGSHPEYWTEEMLDALRSYLNDGGRLMYLGGNGFYWVTSLDRSGEMLEVRRWGGSLPWESEPGEYYHSTTGELGGTWRKRGVAPQRLVGVGFTAQGFDLNRPYHRMAGSRNPQTSFIFEGVEDQELIGDFESLCLRYGAAGHEIDRLDFTLGTPPHAILLASADRYSNSYRPDDSDFAHPRFREGPATNPLVRSDMVFLEYPKGGAVFSVGSISWCGCLPYNNYENNVSRITENVLRRFSR